MKSRRTGSLPVQVERVCLGRTSKAACSTRSLVVVLISKSQKKLAIKIAPFYSSVKREVFDKLNRQRINRKDAEGAEKAEILKARIISLESN